MKSTKKISKNLWISVELAAEFDECLRRLSQLLPHEKVEAGELGAAAILSFLLLSTEEQIRAIRDVRVYPLDKVLHGLRTGSLDPVDEDVFARLEAYVKGRRRALQARQTSRRLSTRAGKRRAGSGPGGSTA